MARLERNVLLILIFYTILSMPTQQCVYGFFSNSFFISSSFFSRKKTDCFCFCGMTDLTVEAAQNEISHCYCIKLIATWFHWSINLFFPHLFINFNLAFALTCYNCDSLEHPYCDDVFDPNSVPKTATAECQDGESCVKLKFRIGCECNKIKMEFNQIDCND